MRYVKKFAYAVLALAGITALAVPALANGDQIRLTAIQGSVNTELAARILQVAYPRIGKELTISRTSARRSLLESSAGMSDGEVQRIWEVGERNPSLLRVNVPLFGVDVAYFKTTDFFTDTSFSKLSDKRVAYLNGVIYAEEVTRDFQNTVKVSGHDAMFQMLEHRRIDIVVTSTFAGFAALKRLGYTDIERVDPPLRTISIYHYVHQKNASLVGPLERVIVEMSKNGEIDAIVRRYLTDNFGSDVGVLPESRHASVNHSKGYDRNTIRLFPYKMP